MKQFLSISKLCRFNCIFRQSNAFIFNIKFFQTLLRNQTKFSRKERKIIFRPKKKHRHIPRKPFVRKRNIILKHFSTTFCSFYLMPEMYFNHRETKEKKIYQKTYHLQGQWCTQLDQP